MSFSKEQGIIYIQRTNFNPSVLQAPTAYISGYLKTAFPALSSFLSTRTSCILFCLCKMIKITTTHIALEWVHKEKFPSLSSEPQGTLQGWTQQNTTPCACKHSELLSPKVTVREPHCTAHTAHVEPDHSLSLQWNPATPLSKRRLGLSAAGLPGTITGSPPKLNAVPKSIACSHSLLGSEQFLISFSVPFRQELVAALI